MTTLKVASKANQATTLPALLVAAFVRESNSDATLKINHEEVDILNSGDNASVALVQENKASIYGSKDVIEELLSTYSSLEGKHGNLVRVVRSHLLYEDSIFLDQGMARPSASLLPHRLQGRRRNYARA